MEKNFINAQIKALRKALKLSQTEFGEKIGLKAGAIGKMEKEGGTVIEQNIKLICEKFNVRREWLTEGTGDMLQETEDTLFASFAERYHLSPDDQVLARYLLQLTSEERQMVIKHIMQVSELLRQGRSKEAPNEGKEQPAPTTSSTLPTDPKADSSSRPEGLSDEEWDVIQHLRMEKDAQTPTASSSIKQA